MAKPNYQFDKRQRELAKQKAQKEKLAKKQAKQTGGSPEQADVADTPAPEAQG